MHLPKRAVQNAVTRVRPLSCATAAASITLLLVWLLGPSAVQAMSRSSHPHARSVAQEQEPTPSRAHGSKHASKSRSKSKSSATATPSAKPGKKSSDSSRSRARSKHNGRSHDEPTEDAVEMKRASNGPNKAMTLNELAQQDARQEAARRSDRRKSSHKDAVQTADNHTASRSTTNRSTSNQKNAPEQKNTQTAAVSSSTDAGTHAATKPSVQDASSHKLSTEDFMRAANGAPSNLAQGQSHPDEMDETQPSDNTQSVVIVKQPVQHSAQPVRASVSAETHPARDEASSAPARVDGFGAEGAVASGRRTLARTMARHRNDPLVKADSTPAPSAPPVPTAEETAAITDEVVKPQVMPAIYTRGGRLVMPAPLKGSHEILVHQNQMADAAGLERLRDEDALQDAISSHKLVRLPETEYLHVNDDLPVNRRYARPWTVRFAVETSKAFEARFGTALQVNSAVRTVSYQLRLQRTNGNAAAVEGDSASPHLTGQAIDFGKRGMSKAQLAWMRAYLLPLMDAGKIDVEEEFQQACFHISVYRSYLSAPRRKSQPMETATVRRAAHSHDDDDADNQ